MSKDVIRGLSPVKLWQRFLEISRIPRASGKEEKIREYLREAGKELNLAFKEDDFGNIVMSVPAGAGHENAGTVVLQSHVDMVCEKNKATVHDFDHDPITLIRDDGWIRAEGTTLGADNGIGVAASLAIASDGDVVHGPLELLFTVQEETGLVGASHLKPGFIEGKTLLNLDSEESTAFYVGCAGGEDTVGRLKIETMNRPVAPKAYDLLVTGLKGGHSGLDIHKGRANAIKLLGRLLKRLEVIHYQVAELKGGSKRNAIPREAEATILIDPTDVVTAKTTIDGFLEEVLGEYRKNDGGLMVELNEVGGQEGIDRVFTKDFLATMINVIHALPHGVIAMSPDIPGLVETSTNLATIGMAKDTMKIETSQRSSFESAKAYVTHAIEAVFKLAGAEISCSESYPGWNPNMNSPILKLSKTVYKRLFNEDPETKAVHAGLECGILGAKYPGLDAISFGPAIEGAHSPDERVNIEDVDRFYRLLKGILMELATQP